MTTNRREASNAPFNVVTLMSSGGGVVTNLGRIPIYAKAGGNTAPNTETEENVTLIPPLFPRGESFQSDPNSSVSIPDNSEPVWIWTQETGAVVPINVEVAT